MYDEFFQKAHELRAAGAPFATAVVVRAEKPTSGKPGDRAIVTLDGTMHGWIGGSCAQPTVIREAVGALAAGAPRLIRLSPDPGTRPVPDGVEEVAMTCFSGGTLDIFIEPHQPSPHLLLVGTLPVARALGQLGRAMGYGVTVVDPGEGVASEDTDEVVHDVEAITDVVGPLTFAVVATHGAFDEPALKAILATEARYVGLVASRARGEAVLATLAADGVDAEALGRIRFPAGLDIKAKRGDEIAVSILAEIIRVRRTIGDVSWAIGTAREPSTGVGEATAAARPAPPATPGREVAVDPVCGMEVRIEGAHHAAEHDGRTYYFCCGGCRSRFASDPDAFLAAS